MNKNPVPLLKKINKFLFRGMFSIIIHYFNDLYDFVVRVTIN